MKSPNNNLLSNTSAQSSPVSNLRRISFRLTLAAALVGSVAVSVFSSYASAQAQSVSAAIAEHPSWAQLPGELIRPDCVHEIPKGARVEIGKDGNLTGDVTLKGELVAHYDSCPEAGILTHQSAVSASAVKAAVVTGNGWVENDHWIAPVTSSDNIDYLAGNFTVPSYPSEYGGQAIYLSNGIESANYKWVLEATLEYGYNGVFGGDYYSITTILVGPSAAYYSSPDYVYPGDSLSGSTRMYDESGNTTYWDVQIADNSSGAYSGSTYWVSGQHWTLAYAGILQAYNLDSCAQFPANGREVFSDSVVYHGFPYYYQYSYPNWVGAGGGYGGPTCHFAVVAASGTLDF
jgi:hypothetical protein